MRFTRECVFALLSLSAYCALAAAQTPTQARIATVQGWTHNCREYVETNTECKMNIDMIPVSPMPGTPGHVPFQYDISIANTEAAAILLQRISPFVKCALTTTPSPSARDLSASITSAFTSVAGMGLFAGNPNLIMANSEVLGVAPMADIVGVGNKAFADIIAVTPDTPPPPPPPALVADLQTFANKLEPIRMSVRPVVRDFRRISIINQQFRYAYASEAQFVLTAAALYDATSSLMQDALPTAVQITTTTGNFNALAASIAAWKGSHAAQLVIYPTLKAQMDTVDATVTKLRYVVDHLADAVRFIGDEQKVFAPLFDLLVQLSDPTELGTYNQGPYLGQVLEINNAPQKKSQQTITCKDVVTTAQAFDTITFTVYFGRNPQIDISAGVLLSLLRGHQVGTVSGPVVTTTNPDGSPTQTAPTELQVTGSSRVQFMPATFFEYHPINFKLPGVTDRPVPRSSPPHPFGYVGSFGLAGGISLNPNNGGATAELFAGISIGIQRFAILFGNHFGRFQDYTGTYSVGDTVPAGTNPPTSRRWTNHPAFAFVYRVPIR